MTPTKTTKETTDDDEKEGRMGRRILYGILERVLPIVAPMAIGAFGIYLGIRGDLQQAAFERREASRERQALVEDIRRLRLDLDTIRSLDGNGLRDASLREGVRTIAERVADGVLRQIRNDLELFAKRLGELNEGMKIPK